MGVKSGGPRGNRFPEDFLWGVSTSAYQIEGSPRFEGRSPSVWDVFSQKPGAVFGGMNGDLACDSYRRWREDVELLRGLGVDSYRFSLAWPRILPEGSGRPNAAGIDHYRRLCEALLEADIEPFVCLYHWDHPQALEEKGGWTERDMAFRFADYAGLCFEQFDGLVSRWMTLNEPWCSSILGYGRGEHAPGRRDEAAAYRAVHHHLLGHGLAVEAFRSLCPRDPGGSVPEIGLALNPALPRPATRRAEDRAAALRASVERSALFMDPLFGRGYPEGQLAAHPGVLIPLEAGDLERIALPIDYLGVNYYNEEAIEAVPVSAAHPEGFRYVPTWQEKTEMGWDIVPAGLGRILAFLAENWPVPRFYVTENGAAFPDEPDAAGRVRDGNRIEYLRAHLKACEEALESGIPVGGYFVWSLLDNFEWSWGYSKRFGLVWIDFRNGERRPKDSYYYYRDVVSGAGP